MLFWLSRIHVYIQRNIIVPVAVCFILGAALAGLLPPGYTLLKSLSVLAGLLIAGLFVLRRHEGALAVSLSLFFLLGIIHTGNALHPPGNPSHVYNLITERTRVTLTGTVAGMPEFDGQTTRFELDVHSILLHRQKDGNRVRRPAHGRIRLTVAADLKGTITPGEHLLAIATLSRTAGYQTPGVFDYRLYLATRSIYVTGNIRSREAVMPYIDLNETWYTRLTAYPERARQAVGSFLENRLEPEMAGLYKALLIGSRKGISEATLENFKATGCMHLLAISGIHMSLLGMMSALLLTWIMKRSTSLLHHIHVPTAATLFTLPLLFCYAFIAGMNTPVLRALIMAVFFLFGVVLRRQRSIMHIIAAAALLVLFLKPLALFTASFQLSFSAVTAIALLYPRLILLIEQKHSSTRSKIFAYISAALLVSTAATLGSLPFMLLHFNRFSPIGPFINLMVEPFLCLWALPLGLVALPLTFIAPESASFLLNTGAYGIAAAVGTTSFGSRIPFASLWSITPDAPEIILYYGILMLWLYNAFIPGKKKSALVCSIFFLLYFTRGLWLTLPGNVSEVAFLDIGQGSSTFVRMPGGRKILLDGGNNTLSKFDPGESVIAPFLWKNKVWRLDDIIISHPHSDHYNGLHFIIRHFHPKQMWINGRETDVWPYSSLLRAASRRGIPIVTPEMKELEITDGQATLAALHTSTLRENSSRQQGAALSVNDRSMILRLRHGNYRLLFPGDISTRMEDILVKDGEDVQAEVLLAAHHGSGSSGSERFISAVDPDIIVVSAGKNSHGRYPSADHLRKWQADGRTVVEISRVGTVTLATDGRELRIATHVRRPAASVSRPVTPR